MTVVHSTILIRGGNSPPSGPLECPVFETKQHRRLSSHDLIICVCYVAILFVYL